jgi:membrane-associated PAP2 superfamily phosphatase
MKKTWKMITDEHKIRPVLRAFKEGHLSIDFATSAVLAMYGSSRRLNMYNLVIGLVVGWILGALWMWFKVPG